MSPKDSEKFSKRKQRAKREGDLNLRKLQTTIKSARGAKEINKVLPAKSRTQIKNMTNVKLPNRVQNRAAVIKNSESQVRTLFIVSFFYF
jgi:hypothetical protein